MASVHRSFADYHPASAVQVDEDDAYLNWITLAGELNRWPTEAEFFAMENGYYPDSDMPDTYPDEAPVIDDSAYGEPSEDDAAWYARTLAELAAESFDMARIDAEDEAEGWGVERGRAFVDGMQGLD